MADRIIIRGSRGLDGEYEFDIEDRPLTNLEWRWIKKVSGYMPLTIDEGRKGGDPDVQVAFAVIALVRSGKVEKSRAMLIADQLAELPFDGDAIDFASDEEEDDEGPPTAGSVTSTGPLPSDGGEGSTQTSDSPSEKPLPATGIPG